MEFEIVELEEKIIEGICIKTTNENGKAMQDIANMWKRFYVDEIYNKIENKVNNKTIGLYTDYEGDYTKPYNFVACCEVNYKSENIENRVTKTIPKGKYAKFIINGDIQKSVGEAWNKIWNMNLKRKYTCDFEEYQNNTENMQKQAIHIYIAIED